nr:MAG TPA: hypothetical protein [Caudoviricetes sp.]DAY42266.1 MAG TPA: hypothetical protein [Caudoviricetes sp.]
MDIHIYYLIIVSLMIFYIFQEHPQILMEMNLNHLYYM